MKGHQVFLGLGLLTAVLIGCVAVHDRAWAQEPEGWTFVLTPQVWASHVAKNGFIAPGALGGLVSTNDFRTENSAPTSTIDPQWGLQFGAQKGRWSLAGTFQYATFETRSDILYVPANNQVFCIPPNTPPCTPSLSPNERVAQEFVNTTRLDMDFAASYLFPDVIPKRLYFSLGAGVKAIYASASRQYANLSPGGSALSALGPPSFKRPGSGLYVVCPSDDCSDSRFEDRVKSKAWLYGGTLPIGLTFSPTDTREWLLTFTTSPFVGAETRNDEDVVYSNSGPKKVNRIDGTTLAYGVTTDTILRRNLSDTLSVYAGMRVQYIKGHETFLAYGPLAGISVRFGGGK